jgi:release factor glutamine methyltransferase
MLHEPRITSHESQASDIRPDTHADIRSVLRDAMQLLEAAQVPSAPLTAELILMYSLGRDRAWIYSYPEYRLDAAAYKEYCSLIERRAGGVPTQHLTGCQEFWGLEFEVNSDVLIPRPETEHLIEVALELLGIHASQDFQGSRATFQIADVGTGSGCIAIALAHELPEARIVATDISQSALNVASRNAQRHGVASRIQFIECNLLDAFATDSKIINRQSGSEERSGFDLIVSNPPYIGRWEAESLPREVREHEPEAALFGGENGTELYGPLIAQAATLLKPGGSLVVELGHVSAEHVSELLDSGEWSDVLFTKDLAGIPRVVSAQSASR